MRRFMNERRQKTKDKRQKSLSMVIRTLVAHGSWLIALILVMTSCSTTKETSKLKMLSVNHIIKEVENNNFEFDDFEAKFDVKVKGENKLGLKGQLRMQSDSLIWISVSLKVGIEMGRIMISEDSLKFINRSNKTYMAESLEYVNEILPVEASIKFLQDILIGNSNQIKRNDNYKVAIENDSYKLFSNENSVLTKDIWVTPKTFKINKYVIRLFENDRNEIQLRYDNFQKINGKFLPTKIIFELNSGEAINIEIDYSEIKVGEKPSFPFNVSKKYERRRL